MTGNFPNPSERKFLTLVKDFAPLSFSTLGSVGLAIAGILPKIEEGEWDWFSPTSYSLIFVFSLLFATLGSIWQGFRAPGYQTLKDELQRAIQAYNLVSQSYRKVINDELSLIFEILDFKDSERISLYKHDGKALAMIGRHSTNSMLRAKGRGIIRESEGVVGKAWASNDDEAFVDNLPEAISDDDDFDYVAACCRDWGMERTEAHNLTMKSRTLGAFAIRDLDNTKIEIGRAHV